MFSLKIRFLIAALFIIALSTALTLSQQPIGLTAVCSVVESPPFDGMTEKEESQLTTTVTCSDRTFVFRRTLYTFNGCKQVAMEWQDGELIPIKSQSTCKVGFVAACRDAIKATRPHPKPNEPISLTNLSLSECKNVPLTNTLLDGG